MALITYTTVMPRIALSGSASARRLIRSDIIDRKKAVKTTSMAGKRISLSRTRVSFHTSIRSAPLSERPIVRESTLAILCYVGCGRAFQPWHGQ